MVADTTEMPAQVVGTDSKPILRTMAGEIIDLEPGSTVLDAFVQSKKWGKIIKTGAKDCEPTIFQYNYILQPGHDYTVVRI